MRRIADDADDDAVEDRRRAAYDVDVPVRDGVVRAGADGCYHRENTVIRAEPYRRVVTRASGSSGSTRSDVSTTTRAALASTGREEVAERRRVLLPLVVRRIDEHEVVPAATCAVVAKRGRDITVRDRCSGQAQLLEVRLDHARGLAIALDEDTARRAPRERLETHRPRSGEEIEHRGTIHRPDQRERRFPHAIAGRAGRRALRRCDAVALPRAGNDPHDSPRCSASPSRRSTSSARRPSSGSARAASRARSRRSWSRRSRTKRRSE